MRRSTAPLAAALSALVLWGCDAGTKPGEAPAGPQLFVTAPRMDQTIAVGEDRKVELVLDLRNYPIGKVDDGKNGQHVHVIVDNQPYEAIYDVTRPIVLKAEWMTDGTHVVRAFPSAGPKDPAGALHHESRKNPGSFAWVRFHVNAKGGALAEWDPKAPLLTYSRPKGDYKVGSPEHAKFMVDFYVGNVKLGPGEYSVKATLDGAAVGEWREWKPQVLPASPGAGDHTLVLELIDRDGKPAPGPFNRTERKFKVSP